MSDIGRLRTHDRGQICPNVGLLGLPLRPGASSAPGETDELHRKDRTKDAQRRGDVLAATPIRSPSSVVRPPNGGARRDRTDDLMLAKHALSQLSYGPVGGRRSDIARPTTACRPSSAIRRFRYLVGLGGLEPPTSRLSSARSNQLSYKPGSENGGRRRGRTDFRSPITPVVRSSEKKERRRRRGPANAAFDLSRLILNGRQNMPTSTAKGFKPSVLKSSVF